MRGYPRALLKLPVKPQGHKGIRLPRGYTRHSVSGVTDKRPRSGKHVMGRALFSVPDDDWDAFDKAVKPGNRSAVLRDFIAWYLRRPNAKLPRRPPADPGHSDS
jgi:hypothetical protein